MARKAPRDGAKSYNPDPEPAPDDNDTELLPDLDDEVEPQNIGDILELDPERMAKLRRRKIDTRVTSVRLFEVDADTTKKTRIPGEFLPEEMNTAWLQKMYGAGRYQVVAFNSKAEYLAGTIVDIKRGRGRPLKRDDDEDDEGEDRGARGSTRLERALERQSALIEKLLLLQNQAPKDPIRESIAAMATMVQAQAAAQLQSLEMQMKVRDHMNGPGTNSNKEMLDFMRDLVKREPQQNGAPSLELLKLGLALGTRMNGLPTAEGKNEKGEWLDFARDLSDTLGVPLVAAFSQLLPPDKARAVIDAINTHSEARVKEAEAEAVAATEEDE